MDISVGEIAALVGGSVTGEPALRITGLSGVKEAQAGDLTFLSNRKYLACLETTGASAVLISPDFESAATGASARKERAFIRVKNPYLAFVQVVQRYAKGLEAYHPSGIHPTAVVGHNVKLGRDVALDAHVRIADGCVIGDHVVIYAGVYIGHECRIGDHTVIYPNATIRERVTVGARCIIHAGAVLGSDGFGFIPMNGAWLKVPQAGTVVIGDDVEIGANSAVDRATIGSTVVGRGTKIDNLVQIGHNVEIGEDCVISGMSGLAGSVTVGNHVAIGAQVGVADHARIGDGAMIGARAVVISKVEPGRVVSGHPLMDHKQELRMLAGMRHLPEWSRRIRDLEQRILALEEELRGKSEDHS